MTTAIQAAAVCCSYCLQPAEGLRSRLIYGDPTSPVVALDHEACYPIFLDDLILVSSGVPGAHPQAGSCHLCRAHTPRARVIAEIHTSSGAGAIVVRCLGCCKAETQAP